MIRFGVAGNSQSFYNEGFLCTEQSPSWLRARGLDVFEYSFGRGVRMNEVTASRIKTAAELANVVITAHAPYYINLANSNDDMIEKSIRYIMDTAKAVVAMGGNRCIYHAASQGKVTRGEAMSLTLARTEKLIEIIYKSGLSNVNFCPETMGKRGQIGDVNEVLEMCKLAPFMLPTLDFGHINARSGGKLRSKDDYKREIDKVFNAIGAERAKQMHIHFSKIQYSALGEVRHLTLADTIYGPPFEPLAEVLYEYKMEPYIISESAGTQAEDAQFMKEVYATFAK